MTRPTVRMYARCQRTTDEPVLVHEVHAPSGPGFNVYACPECATHYPPLTNVLELLATTPRQSRLTLHAYKIDTEGTVVEDRGRVEILAGGRTEPLPWTSAYPPCACQRCKAQR